VVNAISESEVTELDDEHRSKLISVIIMVGLAPLTVNRGHDRIPYVFRLADGARAAAIILYGTVFGLGGLLQLINFRHYDFHDFWHYPFLQICEILAALLVVGPLVAARYNTRWRMFILGHDFQAAMKGVGGSLAAVGAIWALIVIINGFATFTMPLMPLLVGYTLLWPGCALLYLLSNRAPTMSNVIFPFPRIVAMFQHKDVVEPPRDNRSDRHP
jgi:hypothetical protein